MIGELVLGILQGIFEWVPVSSEGVVAVAGSFMDIANPIELALFLHLGTLFAVLLFFRRDWKEVLRFEDSRLFRFLMLSTVVSLGVGFAIYNSIKDIKVGTSLLVLVGVGLLFTSWLQRSGKRLNMGDDAVAILAGVLQGISVIPGLSRSGATIFGLSLGDFKPGQILKYSYMMSAPAVLASSIYLIAKGSILYAWPALIAAFIVGLFSLKYLMKYSESANFANFTLLFAVLCFAGALLL